MDVWCNYLMFCHKDVGDLAERLAVLLAMDRARRTEMEHDLRRKVATLHDITSLSDRLVGLLHDVQGRAS
jgi:hypothetical protein